MVKAIFPSSIENKAVLFFLLRRRLGAIISEFLRPGCHMNIVGFQNESFISLLGDKSFDDLRLTVPVVGEGKIKV